MSNWALYKVSQNEIDDDKIAVMIKAKLGDTPGISYAEIARCAITAGRPNLAIKVSRRRRCFFFQSTCAGTKLLFIMNIFCMIKQLKATIF